MRAGHLPVPALHRGLGALNVAAGVIGKACHCLFGHRLGLLRPPGLHQRLGAAHIPRRVVGKHATKLLPQPAGHLPVPALHRDLGPVPKAVLGFAEIPNTCCRIDLICSFLVRQCRKIGREYPSPCRLERAVESLRARLADPVVVGGVRHGFDPAACCDQVVEEGEIFDPYPVLFGKAADRLESLSAHQRASIADYVEQPAPGARGPQKTPWGAEGTGVDPGIRVAIEADARRGDTVRTGEERGAHQARDRVREQDVVVVEKQQPLAPRYRRRRVACGSLEPVLLPDHAPALLRELALERVEALSRRGALAPVVDQHHIERRVVLAEYAAHRHTHQLGPLVMDDAHRDERGTRFGGTSLLGEAFGRGLEGCVPLVPARPYFEGVREVPAGARGAKRRSAESRDTLAELDVVGRDERAGAVRRQDELRRPAGRGRDEWNARVQTLHDRERRTLPRGGQYREPPWLREIGDCLAGAEIGERANIDRPVPGGVPDDLGAVEALGRAAEERDACRRTALAHQPVDRIDEHDEALARLQPAEEHYLLQRGGPGRGGGGRCCRRREGVGPHE